MCENERWISYTKRARWGGGGERKSERQILSPDSRIAGFLKQRRGGTSHPFSKRHTENAEEQLSRAKNPHSLKPPPGNSAHPVPRLDIRAGVTVVTSDVRAKDANFMRRNE